MTWIEQLRRLGTDTDELRDLLLCEPDEVVLLVGSIAEGFGNRLSDIDLLVIGRPRFSGDVMLDEGEFCQCVFRLPSGAELNVEYWSPDYVANVCAELAQAAEIAEAAATGADVELKIFTQDRMRLLHRLSSGIPVDGNVEAWRGQVQSAHLADYLTIYWLSHHFTSREDAIAQCEDGDPRTALLMMRTSMERLIHAVLASAGETNPNQKWALRLLDRHTEAIGEDLCQDLLRHVFPQAGADPQAWVRDGCAVADRAVGRAFALRPHLGPVAMGVMRTIQFVSTPA